MLDTKCYDFEELRQEGYAKERVLIAISIHFQEPQKKFNYRDYLIRGNDVLSILLNDHKLFKNLY